jgi:hypothetical protein
MTLSGAWGALMGACFVVQRPGRVPKIEEWRGLMLLARIHSQAAVLVPQKLEMSTLNG